MRVPSSRGVLTFAGAVVGCYLTLDAGLPGVGASVAGAGVGYVLGKAGGRFWRDHLAAREVIERAVRMAREARDTGAWELSGGLTEVRWDGVAQTYFVRSVDARTGPGKWTAWQNIDGLARFLEGLEGDGWAYRLDGPTGMIRARLDLPGWWEDWSGGRIDV